MKLFQKRSFFSFMIALGVGANLFCGAVLTARAEVIDYQALAEANLSIPVESNEDVYKRQAVLLPAFVQTALPYPELSRQASAFRCPQQAPSLAPYHLRW